MKTLKHEQARYYLHTGHEYLNRSEQESLKRHLSECSTCQTYAIELNALQTTLSRVMHAYWDARATVLVTDSKIQTRLRRKIVQKRVLNLIGSLASGTVVLGLIIIIVGVFGSPEPLPAIPGSAAVPSRSTATFGGNITLLSYTMNQEHTATGDILNLTLYWQSQTAMQTSYAVFIHLQDQNDRMLAQSDALPMNGKHLTTDWKPGEVIEDRREIKLPTDLTPGEYRLILGLYDPSTGARLNTSEGKDTIALAPVEFR